MDERDVFDLLATAAIGVGLDHDIVLNLDGDVYKVLLFPDLRGASGVWLTADVFDRIADPFEFASRLMIDLTLTANLGLAEDTTWQERLEGLIPFVRHAPNCPIGLGLGGSGGDVCTCSLDGELQELAEDLRIVVIRCRGCGQHAATPDGTEDWAYRGPANEPFCNSCAVALGA